MPRTKMGSTLDYDDNHPETPKSISSLISALEYFGGRCRLYILNKREIKSDDVEIIFDNREPVVAYGTSHREFFREKGIDFVVSLDTDSCMSVVSYLKRRIVDSQLYSFYDSGQLELFLHSRRTKFLCRFSHPLSDDMPRSKTYTCSARTLLTPM